MTFVYTYIHIHNKTHTFKALVWRHIAKKDTFSLTNRSFFGRQVVWSPFCKANTLWAQQKLSIDYFTFHSSLWHCLTHSFWDKKGTIQILFVRFCIQCNQKHMVGVVFFSLHIFFFIFVENSIIHPKKM